MKKFLTILLSLLLVFSMSGCSKDISDNQQDEETIKVPTGIWVLRYIGDENGEYVEEFNMMEMYNGMKINIIEHMIINYGETVYLNLDENGKGIFSDFTMETSNVSFDEEKITYDDGTTKPYVIKDGKLIFVDEQNFYFVFENVSEETLNKIKAGAIDCVDLDKAEVGDLIALGQYDIAPGNDKLEPIKWRVLDKQGDRLFVLCDQLIDSYAYNTNPNQTDLDSVTWENSTVRVFLNSPEGFLSMFSEEELALIETTHLENKEANDRLNYYWGNLYDVDGATYSDMGKQNRHDDPETDDKVFLLSLDELEKYFGEASEPSPDDNDYPFSELLSNPKWKAKVTLAVSDNGTGYFDRDTLYGEWMLRTLSSAHSNNGQMTTYVSRDGQLYNYFTYASLFIRPAMWIKVK